MVKEIVTKAEFARRCSVSAAAITKACAGRLAPAVVGKRIDAAHSAAVEYWQEKAPPGAERPEPKPKPKARGHVARNAAKKAEPPPELDEMPEEIQAVADMTLRELVQRFGTETRFNDWLKALKAIEDIREKRNKNAEREGELIPRDIVKTHIVGRFEQAHISMMDADAQTIAARLHALYASGSEINEGRDFIVATIGKTIRSAKSAISRTLRNA